MNILNNFFGLLNFAGFTLSIIILYFISKKFKLDIFKTINLYLLFISVIILFGLIGFSLIYQNFNSISIDFKNHSHLGSTILMFFIYSILFNQLWFKNIIFYFDLFIIPGSVFQIIAKTGCYFGQCCSGIVNIPEFNINMPLQFAEAIILIVNTLIISAVIYFNKLSIGSGKIFYLYILLFSFERFFAEFYRDESINEIFGIRISFIFLAIMILVSTYVLIKKSKNNYSQLMNNRIV